MNAQRLVRLLLGVGVSLVVTACGVSPAVGGATSTPRSTATAVSTAGVAPAAETRVADLAKPD
jgi:hypothetical protein